MIECVTLYKECQKRPGVHYIDTLTIAVSRLNDTATQRLNLPQGVPQVDTREIRRVVRVFRNKPEQRPKHSRPDLKRSTQPWTSPCGRRRRLRVGPRLVHHGGARGRAAMAPRGPARRGRALPRRRRVRGHLRRARFLPTYSTTAQVFGVF